MRSDFSLNIKASRNTGGDCVGGAKSRKRGSVDAVGADRGYLENYKEAERGEARR